MKSVFVFALFALFSVSALSLAEDANKRPKPPATVAPAKAFTVTLATTTDKTTTTTVGQNTTTVGQNTTTVGQNTTTVGQNTTTLAPNTTTVAPNTTTTVAPHNTTTTVAPHNTTTTVAPHNTTTTVAPHNTTTTVAPNTTTTSPHTTTTTAPVPTPPTNLTTGTYTLKDKEDKVCLKAQFALQIRLVSPKVKGTFIVQPSETKPVGSCEEPKANLTLSFKQGFITFMFNKNISDNTVYVNALSFQVSYPFGGANAPYIAENKTVHLLPAKIGHSYSCRNESLYMGHDLYLDISQNKMQAFNLTNQDFGTADPCPADQPDYSVAIGVGVALLVLIVIVVVVYLLSRRKRTDGYQSL
ncbi:Lysosome-associated membrane glycoprotein 1 [Channa argus]|uniref:Lysosome-associated membrane glycoprotein 1 n=1 Tax=Channa argus TaxID=215402 RepID=A0A6G1Q4F4_CHAAH|nr:Lysosome-associated membrane glycoprotein 1 [Channa argus]